MRPPLALVSIFDPKKQITRWVSVHTEITAKGLLADTVVFVRTPSVEEYWALMACMAHAVTPRVYRFEQLVRLGIHLAARETTRIGLPAFHEMFPEATEVVT